MSSEFYYSGSTVSVYKGRMDSYILNTIEGRRNKRNFLNGRKWGLQDAPIYLKRMKH